MAYSLSLFLVVSILFHCYGINGEEAAEVTNIRKQSGFSPLETAGLIIQQIGTEITSVGQMYFFYKNEQLIYADEKINGSLMIWHGKNGNTERYLIQELEEEKITTITQTKADPNKFLIGSELNLRLYQRNNKGHTITEPLVKFNEPGFMIRSAYADEDGNLFTLLIAIDRTSKLGKLYKIQNKTAHLVKELKQAPIDFRFNEKCTKMFMIYENGTKIKSMEYDMKKVELSKNHTDVFDKNDYPILKNNKMMSVVLDQTEGHLWVSAAGPIGYLLEINPNNKTLVATTALPNKDLTYVTFGAVNYKAVFVGSKGTCVKGKGQGSVYSVTGMGKKGCSDKPVKW